jgi:hypothetical protein
MPALCCHVSMTCPKFDEPVAQVRLDETITNAPPDLHAMGHVDWLQARIELDGLLATVKARMLDQMADVEQCQEARRGDHYDEERAHDDDNGNGGGE